MLDLVDNEAVVLAVLADRYRLPTGRLVPGQVVVAEAPHPSMPVRALTREEDGERRSGRTRADNRHAHYERSAATGLSPGRLRILPPGVFAVASTTVNAAGTLYGDNARAQCFLRPSRSGLGVAKTTSARGT